MQYYLCKTQWCGRGGHYRIGDVFGGKYIDINAAYCNLRFWETAYSLSECGCSVEVREYKGEGK